MQMNAREAMHLLELRSGPRATRLPLGRPGDAPPDRRAGRATDCSPRPCPTSTTAPTDLERLESERRAEAARGSRCQPEQNLQRPEQGCSANFQFRGCRTHLTRHLPSGLWCAQSQSPRRRQRVAPATAAVRGGDAVRGGGRPRGSSRKHPPEAVGGSRRQRGSGAKDPLGRTACPPDRDSRTVRSVGLPGVRQGPGSGAAGRTVAASALAPDAPRPGGFPGMIPTQRRTATGHRRGPRAGVARTTFERKPGPSMLPANSPPKDRTDPWQKTSMKSKHPTS